ncbi:glycoside hydrolase family 71/99-like protein [Bremerella sp. JC817]|uniref:glycoside hydrolase family 71/99-like protein n=1 Tax=Bremerella sp. JC817 TaxID=3231756 RepID=UPI0034583A0B
MQSRATSLPHRRTFWLTLLLAAGVSLLLESPLHAQPKPVTDATTLEGKVMTGYQGWFRCPGDGTERGWLHWSRRSTITPQSLTFEMWPDLSEFSSTEKYAVPGFSHVGGTPAYLYSSVNKETIQRHFQWMQQYGIDGAFVQRFLVNLRDPSFEKVLENVRVAAKDSGRAFGICYDLSGYPTERIYDRLTEDWRELCDRRKVTRDERYLDHDGLPVVFLWGLYSDRFDAKLAHQLIDFFHEEGPYRATVIGGVPPQWRRDRDPQWAAAYRKLDVISPWNVGNIEMRGGEKIANTNIWKGDQVAATEAGVRLLPVIYPGFAWTNLKGPVAQRDTIERRRGDFFWEQWVAAAKLKTGMVYVAMFDEVDEATAIFKVTNDPPTQGSYATYDGLPSDWYLRLAGEGGRMLRGEVPISEQITITPQR